MLRRLLFTLMVGMLMARPRPNPDPKFPPMPPPLPPDGPNSPKAPPYTPPPGGSDMPTPPRHIPGRPRVPHLPGNGRIVPRPMPPNPPPGYEGDWPPTSHRPRIHPRTTPPPIKGPGVFGGLKTQIENLIKWINKHPDAGIAKTDPGIKTLPYNPDTDGGSIQPIPLAKPGDSHIELL